MRTLTALLTCHDRRESTLACLRSLFAQRNPGVQVRAVLVDDGCTDGTGDAVRRDFPHVEVVRGSGDLYWSAGMSLAQRHAVRDRPDYLLWLNDDVVLLDSAVRELVRAAGSAGPDRVVAGALRDPRSGATTYTGLRRVGLRPRGFVPLEPSGDPQQIDTFNGNVVLVPRPVYRVLGGVDAELRHAFGDLDYGLRARRQGYHCLLAPRHVGDCTRNPTRATWRDPELGRRQRVLLLLGPKGIPLRPHIRYLRRHAGPGWPFFALGSYGKALANVALRRAG